MKAAPTVRDQPLIAYGVVALIFLLVLLWGPLNSQRGIWGTLVLAGLVDSASGPSGARP